jgi:UDPglucose 6-dehydrogenase
MEALWDIGAKVQAYDPVAIEECNRIYGTRPDLTLCKSAEKTLHNADCLVIVTEWTEFRSPDFERIKALLNDAVIVDGRNLYDPQHMQSIGIDYYAIGRGL